MLFKTQSAAVYGIDAYLVEVEVDIYPGKGDYITVGLPDLAVKESRERTKSAIKNRGLDFPFQNITVNLAPADVRKEGSFICYFMPVYPGARSHLHNPFLEYPMNTEKSFGGFNLRSITLVGVAMLLCAMGPMIRLLAQANSQLSSCPDPIVYINAIDHSGGRRHVHRQARLRMPDPVYRPVTKKLLEHRCERYSLTPHYKSGYIQHHSQEIGLYRPWNFDSPFDGASDRTWLQ